MKQKSKKKTWKVWQTLEHKQAYDMSLMYKITTVSILL